MQDNPDTINTPEWAAEQSRKLLATEEEAVQHAQTAAETAAFQAEDNVMEAVSNLRSAEKNSRAFAQQHLGPLVEAAIADAAKDGVTINR